MEKSLYQIRDDYTLRAKADNAKYHEVVFAVKQQNLDKLEKFLFEVSDPKNSKYGQYLSRSEVADMTANPKATQVITDFLIANGATITKKTPHGEYITARAKVELWEKLFATTFYEFEHESKPVVRAKDYSLPVELADHVHAVFNTVQLPPRSAPRKQLVKKGTGLQAAGSITPAVLNSYYHITSNTGSAAASQSVFESLEQYYSPADLQTFEANYGLPSEAVAYDIGGYESDSECVSNPNNCAEANLDVQYLIAVSQVTPTTYWYSGATDSFLAWIQDVAASTNPPLVHSISYGAVEPELPTVVVNSFNTEAMKLGAQGITILVSSGDDGVAK
jgi:tripeptidyl-peptidase-1